MTTAQGGYFEHEAIAESLLAGQPMTYIGTPVFGHGATEELAKLDVMLMLAQDAVPLPTKEARGGWCDDRHLDYWLCGLHDAKIAMQVTGLNGASEAAVLDFGGGPARMMRHLVREMPHAKLYLSDADPEKVALCNATLGERAWAFRTTSAPHLPFGDKALNAILALSAFVSMPDEAAWLLEFKRVLAPGGVLYTTVFDGWTWSHNIPDSLIGNSYFQSYRERTPHIIDRTVFFPSKGKSGCVVFHPESYVRRTWGRLFDVESMVSGAHEQHAGVLLRA